MKRRIDACSMIDTVSAFTKKYVTRGLLPYFWLAVLSALLSVIAVYMISVYTDYKFPISREPIQLLGVLSVIGIVGLVIVLRLYNRLTTKKLIFLAIVCGFILRLVYCIYTPALLRQHDTDVYYTYNIMSNGHFGYILTIFNTGKLPATNDYQMYHPPLMHLLCAFGVWVGNVLNIQLKYTCELLQIYSLFFSSAMTVVMAKIIRRMKLSEPMTVTAVMIAVFHPFGILLSGSINNDVLMWLLFCIAVLYLMKWYENPAMKNIVMIALALGLGMMTKMSAALLIPVIAVTFIYKFAKNFKSDLKSYFSQFAVFLSVSVPIGMWYPIRNYILFGQELNYVTRLDTDTVYYTGKYPFAERFALDFSELLESPFWHNTDKNVWMILAKTACFDEFSVEKYEPMAAVLVVLNILFFVASVAAVIYVLLKERKFNYLLLGSVWALLIASFVKFSIDFPYVCTSNFRYIFPAAMIGAVFIGRSCELLKKRQKWVSYAYCGGACVFVISVCVAYLSSFMTKF